MFEVLSGLKLSVEPAAGIGDSGGKLTCTSTFLRFNRLSKCAADLSPYTILANVSPHCTLTAFCTLFSCNSLAVILAWSPFTAAKASCTTLSDTFLSSSLSVLSRWYCWLFAPLAARTKAMSDLARKKLAFASIKLSIATTVPILFCAFIKLLLKSLAVVMPLFCWVAADKLTILSPLFWTTRLGLAMLSSWLFWYRSYSSLL